MNIRWRLGILAFQIAVLLKTTYLVTGRPVAMEAWFLAGLLAIVINPQLLEPWYPKPQDVLANALIALFLIWTSSHGPAAPGWLLLAIFVVGAGIASFLALALGAGRPEGPGAILARASSAISRVASAAVIYSAVFWLAAVDYRPNLTQGFWTLGGAWAVLMLLGHVNWQLAWFTVTGAPLPCTPEGMIGPSTLMLASVSLPAPGSVIQLRGAQHITSEGVVLTRIRRASDVWGQVHIHDINKCEELVAQSALNIETLPGGTSQDFAGAVDVGSTDRSLRFITTRSLEIGHVVCVNHETSRILYQLAFAEIEQSTVRGGSHLVVRARAAQLGSYSPDRQRITMQPWVPAPGAAVRTLSPANHMQEQNAPAGWFLLGCVIATRVPVYLDLEAICQGHLAILGMTRMGKTTLALQLARSLATDRRVTILDQTGEYVARQRLNTYLPDHDELPNGISVFEPSPGRVAADEAYNFLSRLVQKAAEEYRVGQPRSRVLIVDEAHQFIPEPAGLGFNTPGRDSAHKFGVLMMQVRKFGITIVLISQRTAVVGKSALSQCENLIAFKSVDQTGLDYLEAVLGENARFLLPVLAQRQALVFGPATSTDAPVAVDVAAR